MGHGLKLTDERWDALDRLRFSTNSADIFRNCLIILMSDSRDTIAAIAEHLGCGTDTVVRVRRLYRQGGVAALRPIKPAGASQPGDAGVCPGAAAGRTHQSLDLGLWFLDLVGGASGRAPGQNYRPPLWRRSVAAVVASGRILRPASPAHHEWQTQRGGPPRPNRHLLAAAVLPQSEPDRTLVGHLKRTVLANVRFRTLDDLTRAFVRGVGRVNGQREKKGFIFDHDDILERKTA